MTVRFVGSLRAASGKSTVTLKLEKPLPLKEIVKRIVEGHPKLQHALIDAELNDPRTNALILVNGRDVSALNGLETRLKEGDDLVLIPVVHGG